MYGQKQRGIFNMFVSFDDAFKPKESQNIIPDAILEYLNKQLDSPSLQYVSDENGYCVLTSTNGEYKITGIAFDLTPEMKDILGNNPSIKDIQEYSYNSQKTIPIKMLEDGYIYLNGTKIPIDKLDFDPFNEVNYVSGSFFVYPQKMNEQIAIKMSGVKEETVLQFKRISDNSIDWRAFESEKDKPIRFLIKINIKEHKMIYSISYDLGKAKSIEEALMVADIYNSFASGEGKMNDVPIVINQEKMGEKAFSEEQILFWRKMLALEEKLGINMNPFGEDITDKDVYVGEILYRTLVCKIPVRVRENIISVDGKGDVKKAKEAFDVKRPMAFYFEDHSKAELFKTEIELRGIKAIYNCIIKEFQEESGQFKIVLDNESDEKQKFTVAMYFLTDEELEEYKEEHDIIKEFNESKPVGNYYSVF